MYYTLFLCIKSVQIDTINYCNYSQTQMLNAFDSKQCPRLLYFNVQNVLHFAFLASMVGSSQFKPTKIYLHLWKMKFMKNAKMLKNEKLPAATVNKTTKNKAKILKFIFAWNICNRSSQLTQCFVLIFDCSIYTNYDPYHMTLI